MIGPERLPGLVRWNTFVLAAAMALSWSVIQLAASVAAITMESLSGSSASAGLAPAVFVLAFGLATIPAGRFMDRRGRVPGISIGFAVAGTGALAVFAMTTIGSPLGYLSALAVLGAGLGIVNLARVAAADMYPPERRAGGVGLVLVGAAAGAILGPVVFGPLLAGDGALAVTWLAAAGVALFGALAIHVIRVDPLQIARARGGVVSAAGRRSMRVIFSAEGPRAAAVAIVATQVVMTSLMLLAGLELHHRGHGLPEISGALAAHFFGMFALSPVIGRAVDRVGRRSSLLVGGTLLALSAAALPAAPGAAGMAIALFGIGVGWNIAFVGGTALLADETGPEERAGALGAVDLLNAFGSSAGAAIATAVLGVVGLGIVVAGCLAALALPLLFLARRQRVGVAGEVT